MYTGLQSSLSSSSLANNAFPATAPSFDERQFESETFSSSSSSEEFLKLPSSSSASISEATKTEMIKTNHTDGVGGGGGGGDDSSLTLMFSGSLWMALTRDTMLVNGTAVSANTTDINETMAMINNNKDNAHNAHHNNNNNDDDEFDEFYTDLLTVIMYSLIIVVSLCGNSLVLRMILAKKKLQTTTNILIAWLAVSDLLTTILNIPFNVARFLAMNYPFPALFCKLVPFIQVMCVYVSTLIMGVIAVHRYITVTSATIAHHRTSINTGGGGGGGGNPPASSSQGIYGHGTYHGGGGGGSGVCAGGGGGGAGGVMQMLFRPFMMRGSMCLCAIVTVVWLLAGALATPHSMFNQIVYVPYKNKTYVRCRAEYPKVDFNVRFVLSLEAFFTQYLIPLGLICVLYIKIGSVVAKQGRIAQKANSRRRMEQDSARRRRLTMLILVVLVFGICWLPLNLYHLLVDFRLIKSNFTIFLVCHWIAMSSVCWNPFIYCWLNESFRKGAHKMIIFLCFCCCPRMKQKFLQAKNVNQKNNDTNNNNKDGAGSSSLQTPPVTTTTTTTTTSSSSPPSGNDQKSNNNSISKDSSQKNDGKRQQQQQQLQPTQSSSTLTPPINHHHRKNTSTTSNNNNKSSNSASMRMTFLPRSSSSSICSTSSAVSRTSSIVTNPDAMTTVNSSSHHHQHHNSALRGSQSEQPVATYQNVSIGDDDDGRGQKVNMVEVKKTRPRKFHKLRSFSLKRKHNSNNTSSNSNNQTTPITTMTTLGQAAAAKGGAKKNLTKTARNLKKALNNNTTNNNNNNKCKQKNDKNCIIIIDHQQSIETVVDDPPDLDDHGNPVPDFPTKNQQCESIDVCPRIQTVVGVSKMDEINITTNTMTTAVKSTFV